MKKQVTIYQAKTTLSQLIKDALAGDEIIIAHGKKPLVKLVVIEKVPSALKVLGKYKNKMKVPEDFDAPLEDPIFCKFKKFTVSNHECLPSHA